MSLPADACRWLGLAGSVLLAAGGVTSGALPAVSVGLQRYAGVGLVFVYFGLVVLIGAWWLLGRVLPQERSWHVHTLVIWGAPLAIGPPLFSRDVYSYLAQGAMFLSDFDVYRIGPAQMSGPLAAEVPLIWQDTPTPYGPVFVRVASGVAKVVSSDVVAGVLGMRVVALAGLALMVYFLPRLAETCGVSPEGALWLGALNPLVLLHLIAGAHNDALMLGLLVAGLATRWHALATVLVTMAALVKAPAALGLLALVLLHRRAAVIGIASATTAAVTLAAGTGFGWLSALDTPISATNWSLTTMLGWLTGDLSLWRTLGLVATVGVAIATRKLNPMYALGLTLVALALLGPAIRPWYLLWGVIPIAAAAPEGAIRRWSAIVCATFAMVVLPDGYAATVKQVALACLGGGLAALAWITWRPA